MSLIGVLAAINASAARLEVPFFPDTTDQCGPASLASVLNYWGKTVSPAELRSDVYLDSLKGTLPLDLPPAIRSRGLEATVVNATFEQVKAELDAKRPVIAYLDFGTKRRPIGHYLVVTGYDDDRKGLYVHSSGQKDKFVAYRRFDRGWSDTNRWAMFVSSPTAVTP